MVEQCCSLSPMLVFNSGPIFKPQPLELKDFIVQEVKYSDGFVKDVKNKHAAKRDENNNGEVELYCNSFQSDTIVNTAQVQILPGNSQLINSTKEYLQELWPKAKDDHEFCWLRRCLSASASEEAKATHDKAKSRYVGRRRMSDSLLHNVDSIAIRHGYAASKCADERTVKTKGSLLKNWRAGPRLLFSKSSIPKNEVPEKESVSSPRIGRKLLMPMLNRPGSYIEALTGRRSSDPSVHTDDVQNKSELNSSAESLASSDDDQIELQNVAFDECVFKQEDIKIQALLEEILRAHLLCMREYNLPRCDETSRRITKLVIRLIRAMKESDSEQVKIVCQVYIGAVQEEGIHSAAQALWDSRWDNFASANFRNDDVFGLIAVLVIPC